MHSRISQGWTRQVQAAIRDVLDDGFSIAEAARRHGIDRGALGNRLREFRAANTGRALEVAGNSPVSSWLQRRLEEAARSGSTALFYPGIQARRKRREGRCRGCKRSFEEVGHHGHDLCTACHQLDYQRKKRSTKRSRKRSRRRT